MSEFDPNEQYDRTGRPRETNWLKVAVLGCGAVAILSVALVAFAVYYWKGEADDLRERLKKNAAPLKAKP